MTTAESQKASSFSSPYCYHVFLSFRGEDTSITFTDQLYTALVHTGYRTFRDNDGIGEDIKFELQKAILESRVSIVIFSQNYASSSWCLDELVMILRRRTTSNHAVLPVFYDVNPSQVRNQMESYQEAFMSHQAKIEAETGERKEELMGKVGKWRAALKEVTDLAGMSLQHRVDGCETRIIQNIVKVVGEKLRRTTLDIAPYPIGIHSRAKDVQLWLEDRSENVEIVAICGISGIGKTTIAKFLYDLNFSRFDGSSFLANVKETSNQQDGLCRLQGQFLEDICKTRKVKISNVDEGTVKIKDALRYKRVLIVLDDVDRLEQLDIVLGMRDMVFLGSKIIITTRRKGLLRGHEGCKVHMVEDLGFEESLELFCWHAFGKNYPINGYVQISQQLVHYCGGLPLVIEVLGASLSGNSVHLWESHLEKLEAIADSKILEKLKIGYDSLEDDHDKNLFVHLACLFVGSDKDHIVTILDECEFFTAVGIQNLIDRCLVRIDKSNALVMHRLLQEMGKEVVRQKSPKELGARNILWNHKNSFHVLTENTGTSKIEGLILDMQMLKNDKSSHPILDVNRKARFQESLDKPLLSNVDNVVKRYSFSISPSYLLDIIPKNSNHVALEVDAFARMHKLKILHLNHVHVSGPYGNFPKGLRWLCWRRFPLEFIPSDFPLESLVALDMSYSSLKNAWEGTKFLGILKILNLSHSYNLSKTPNFSELPNLERLLLKNCANLVEVHESIGQLERLILLNLKDCKNLRRLPKNLGMLKHLETLVISGCSNLEELPLGKGNMESLTVLNANGTSINRLLYASQEVKQIQSFISAWLWMPRKSPTSSWASLPRYLVELSLTHCNLSDDTFPRDISSLSSLNYLDLSYNPICCLPNCIKDLDGLQRLHLTSCYRLRTLVVFQKLNELLIGSNDSLEKIIFPSASHKPKLTRYTDKCDSLVEFMPHFKLEPIGNVDGQILKHLDLSNLEFIGNPIVDLTIGLAGVERKLPLQGCHESHIFCTYLPGSKVPPWFNFTNTGSSISFVVPSHHNLVIQGLSLCSMYGRLFSDEDYVSVFTGYFVNAHTIVCNTTKDLIWSHRPMVFGIPEAGKDMIWLSYWKFENQLEAGDELNISVMGDKFFQVKEVGIHVVYKEQEKKSTGDQSTSEGEEISKQINPYGNVVPGSVSRDSATTKFYQLGHSHEKVCKYCPLLCPLPWNLDTPNNDLS